MVLTNDIKKLQPIEELFFLVGDIFVIHFLSSAWMNYGGAKSRGNVRLVFEMVEVVS